MKKLYIFLLSLSFIQNIDAAFSEIDKAKQKLEEIEKHLAFINTGIKKAQKENLIVVNSILIQDTLKADLAYLRKSGSFFSSDQDSKRHQRALQRVEAVRTKYLEHIDKKRDLVRKRFDESGLSLPDRYHDTDNFVGHVAYIIPSILQHDKEDMAVYMESGKRMSLKNEKRIKHHIEDSTNLMTIPGICQYFEIMHADGGKMYESVCADFEAVDSGFWKLKDYDAHSHPSTEKIFRAFPKREDDVPVYERAFTSGRQDFRLQ